MSEYDPEFELEMESLMGRCREITEIAREDFGDDHPGVKVMEGFDNLLECLRCQYDDYVNCYDPEEKERLRIEGCEMIKEISQLLRRFTQQAKGIC